MICINWNIYNLKDAINEWYSTDCFHSLKLHMPLQKRPNMHYLYEIDGSSLPWKPSHNIRSPIIKSVIFDCHTQIQDFLSIFTSFYPKNMVCGREFRSSLRRPMPNAAKTRPVCRIVPAFTIQANQKNTCVAPPPR